MNRLETKKNRNLTKMTHEKWGIFRHNFYCDYFKYISMENKKERLVTIETISVKYASVIDRILPFTETPSSQQYDDNTKGEDEIRASDLFSLFTADVIKSDIIFSR